MKLPPFTLVHKRMSLHDPRSANDLADRKMQLISEAEPQLGESLASLKQSFRRTLLNSTFALAQAYDGPEYFDPAVPNLKFVVSDLERQPKVTTIGIWELGTNAGFLPRVIEKLNLAQPSFTFFKIQAAIPAGMVSQPARVASWVRENLGRSLSKSERENMDNNIIAEDFFKRAEQVRREVGVDYLIGVASSMVATEEEGWVLWNYFSDSSGRTILASAYEVYEFARKAGRTFEMAVAFIAIGQLLVTLNRPRLGFHDEDRGCLFDKNELRANIVSALQKPHIEPGCLSLIAPKYRKATLILMDVLHKYSREDESDLQGGSSPAQLADNQTIDMIRERILQDMQSQLLSDSFLKPR